MEEKNSSDAREKKRKKKHKHNHKHKTRKAGEDHEPFPKPATAEQPLPTANADPFQPTASSSGKRKHHAPTDQRVVKEKKTKKMKKIHKKARRESAAADDSSSQAAQVDGAHLEGRMVGNQMVLIDHATNTVYSALEVTKSGDRRVVGRVIPEDQSIEMYSDSTAHSKDKEPQEPRHNETNDVTSATSRNCPNEYPFEVDPDDHCESPFEAYGHVLPFLEHICRTTGETSKDLAIYDPYYCNGLVVQNFSKLGFNNVYNRKEDCYAAWKRDADKLASECISYQVLVTNPPYSGHHVPKLVKYITSPSFGDRPFLLLMPQWVHKKDYWTAATKRDSRLQPFFLVPNKRYVYLPPKSFRQAKKSDVHKKSSPFVSMWYIWAGTPQKQAAWWELAQKLQRKAGNECTFQLARSKSALRDLRRAKR